MNVLVPVICSSSHCKMAFTLFDERSQASHVFPLDHNTLMVMIMFMTMIMIVMSQVGTKPDMMALYFVFRYIPRTRRRVVSCYGPLGGTVRYAVRGQERGLRRVAEDGP